MEKVVTVTAGLTEDSSATFEKHSQREKCCLRWLKKLAGQHTQLIRLVALLEVVRGGLLIMQYALLAFMCHQLVIEQQTWQVLMSDVWVFVGLAAIRSLVGFSRQLASLKIAIRVRHNVHKQLLHQFAILGVGYVRQRQSAELATVTLQQVEALQGYFSYYLPQQIIVGIAPLLILAVVLPVNWVVGLILLLSAPLIPLFMILVGMGATAAHRQQFLALRRMNGYFLNRLQGLITLKIFNQAEAELGRIKHISQNIKHSTLSVLRIAFLSSAVLAFFSTLAVALVAVYIGLGLLHLIQFGSANTLVLQSALFLLLLAPDFFTPLKQLASYYHHKAEAIGASDAILAILEEPAYHRDIADSVRRPAQYYIEFQHVNKSYGQNAVLQHFNLQVRAGEKVAIVGESGSGKTTLFNLLLGFEQADQGIILIDGHVPSRSTTERLISWSGQNPRIFFASIAENISLLSPFISKQQIQDAAQKAGVTEFSQMLPNGLNTQIGEQGYGLSGGQVQRIALARAFVKEAPIMLLDEPTAHLDKSNKSKILAVIKEICKDKTLLVVSHDQEVINSMDRVVYLA